MVFASRDMFDVAEPVAPAVFGVDLEDDEIEPATEATAAESVETAEDE